jgi:hypothetical protein
MTESLRWEPHERHGWVAELGAMELQVMLNVELGGIDWSVAKGSTLLAVGNEDTTAQAKAAAIRAARWIAHGPTVNSSVRGEA